MKGKHVSVGYRTVLLVILICFMIPLCSGCEEKSVVMPREKLEYILHSYARNGSLKNQSDVGERPEGNHPFDNCFVFTSFTQMNATEGAHFPVRTKEGESLLRDIYHVPFFRTHDLLVLCCDHATTPAEYRVDDILYNEATGRYDIYITQTFLGESEAMSYYALAIEVEKGMFPEGTAPYFPKIVYTPYRG
ncbi:MAG: hypothetical protein IKM13_06135 [Clostridia bacterium]|nr:hypothetical protein [Clostridia bacterium]